MTPDRGIPVALAATVNTIPPLPFPGVPELIVSQLSAVDAVHAHAVPFVVTLTELPPPPAAEIDKLVDPRRYVHAVCVAVNVWPAMVIVPLREPPTLPSNVQPTLPLLWPDAPETTWSHDALLTAVQLHKAPAVTVIEVPVPAETGTAGSLVGLIEFEIGRAHV